MQTTITIAKPLDEALLKKLEEAGMTAKERKNLLDVEHEDYEALMTICAPYMPEKKPVPPVINMESKFAEIQVDIDKLKEEVRILKENKGAVE